MAAAATIATAATAAIVLHRCFSLTVSSFEVRDFLLGKTFSAVGMPFSILLNSPRSSGALWYLLPFSFSRQRRISWAKSSGIWVLIFLGSGGASVLCFKATLRGVLPSKGTRPVILSKRMIP